MLFKIRENTFQFLQIYSKSSNLCIVKMMLGS